MSTTSRLGLATLLLLLACGPPAGETPVSPATIPAPAAPSTQRVTPAPVASAEPAATPKRMAPSAAHCADGVRAVPGTTPRATIDTARELLQVGCYRELIEALVDPADLAKVLSTMSMDDLVKTFVEEDKATDLQKVLDRSRELAPTLDPVAHTAIFNPAVGVLRMHEIDGHWYIKN